MRTHYLFAVVMVAVLVSAPLALAQVWDSDDMWGPADVRDVPKPTWFGSSGMIVVPTAQSVNPQAIQVHYHSVNLGLPGNEWMDTYGANVGIIDGLEAGATHLRDESETLFQVKYVVDVPNLLDDPDMPYVAIGGHDLGDSINRVLFVAVTKDLIIRDDRTALLRATIGWGDSRIAGAPLDGIFGGIDFSPFDYMRVQIEHDGENINASATYWWQSWIATEIGLLDGDFSWGINAATSF